MKTKIILGMTAIVSLIAMFWLYGHSYIEVSARQTGNLTYSLVNQETGQEMKIKSETGKIKKLVPKGAYQVTIAGDTKSFVSIVNTSGFIKKTTINAKLQNENARKFIGNNPGPCSLYSNGTLMTNSCNDAYSNYNINVPANSDQPTYLDSVKPNDDIISVEGSIQSSQTSEGLLILAQSTDGQSIYKINPDSSTTFIDAYPQLAANDNYQITNYKNGFVIYSIPKSEVYFGQLGQSKLEPLNAKSNDSKINILSSVSTSNNKLVELFTSIDVSEGSDDLSKKESSEGRSIVTVIQGADRKNYSLNKLFANAKACGMSSDLFCLTNIKSEIEVYDLSGLKPNFKYKIVGTASSTQTDQGLLISDNRGVLKFNFDKRQGYYIYTSGDFSSCGIQPSAAGILECVIDADNNKSMLLVSLDGSNTDYIDKKISKLQQDDSVDNVSIYDHYIFISTKVKNDVYDSATNTFSYDQKALDSKHEAINNTLKKIGIDTSLYTVVYAP